MSLDILFMIFDFSIGEIILNESKKFLQVLDSIYSQNKIEEYYGKEPLFEGVFKRLIFKLTK